MFCALVVGACSSANRRINDTAPVPRPPSNAAVQVDPDASDRPEVPADPLAAALASFAAVVPADLRVALVPALVRGADPKGARPDRDLTDRLAAHLRDAGVDLVPQPILAGFAHLEQLAPADLSVAAGQLFLGKLAGAALVIQATSRALPKGATTGFERGEAGTGAPARGTRAGLRLGHPHRVTFTVRDVASGAIRDDLSTEVLVDGADPTAPLAPAAATNGPADATEQEASDRAVDAVLALAERPPVVVDWAMLVRDDFASTPRVADPGTVLPRGGLVSFIVHVPPGAPPLRVAILALTPEGGGRLLRGRRPADSGPDRDDPLSPSGRHAQASETQSGIAQLLDARGRPGWFDVVAGEVASVPDRSWIPVNDLATGTFALIAERAPQQAPNSAPHATGSGRSPSGPLERAAAATHRHLLARAAATARDSDAASQADPYPSRRRSDQTESLLAAWQRAEVGLHSGLVVWANARQLIVDRRPERAAARGLTPSGLVQLAPNGRRERVARGRRIMISGEGGARLPRVGSRDDLFAQAGAGGGQQPPTEPASGALPRLVWLGGGEIEANGTLTPPAVQMPGKQLVLPVSGDAADPFADPVFQAATTRVFGLDAVVGFISVELQE